MSQSPGRGGGFALSALRRRQKFLADDVTTVASGTVATGKDEAKSIQFKSRSQSLRAAAATTGKISNKTGNVSASLSPSRDRSHTTKRRDKRNDDNHADESLLRARFDDIHSVAAASSALSVAGKKTGREKRQQQESKDKNSNRNDSPENNNSSRTNDTDDYDDDDEGDYEEENTILHNTSSTTSRTMTSDERGSAGTSDANTSYTSGGSETNTRYSDTTATTYRTRSTLFPPGTTRGGDNSNTNELTTVYSNEEYTTYTRDDDNDDDDHDDDDEDDTTAVNTTQTSNTTTMNNNNDDEKPTYNTLHKLLENGEWRKLHKFLSTPKGKKHVRVPHPHGGGDYPLHLICDYKFNIVKRAKFLAKKAKREERYKRKLHSKHLAAAGGVAEESSSDDDDDESSTDSDDDETTTQGGEQGVEIDPRRGNRNRPPNEVIIEMLDLYPEAARIRGYGGATPLHHAARLQLSPKVLIALIRSNPQALTIKDDLRQTPRDYEQENYPSANAILERPPSCWIQQVRDEDIHATIEDELSLLEREVEELTEQLETSLQEERELNERMERMEACIERYRDADEVVRAMIERASKTEKEVSMEMESVRDRLEKLMGLTSIRYDNAETERKYAKAFHEDVEKVYGQTNEKIATMRSELEILRGRAK